MISPAEQVRRFYHVLWNEHNLQAMPNVLHEDFRFRGSLGQEKQGHQGFADYVNMVHQALGEYQCIIDEIVSENDKVFAKMTFTGIHQGNFMDYPPTGKRVTWVGCALFKFRGERIEELWVLGDLKALVMQLEQNRA